MEERIIQLESLSALQDQTIQSLNKEIYRQQQDISSLRDQLDKLEKKSWSREMRIKSAELNARRTTKKR